jgi:hypothetical protein
MMGLALHRTLEGHIAYSALSDVGSRAPDHGRQDKSAASGRAHVVVWIGVFRRLAHPAYWRFRLKLQRFQCPERHPGDRRTRSTT